MITPVFDEIPAYEQAFSPILLFFQHPLSSNSQYGSSGFDFVPNRGNLLLLHRPPKKTLHISASNTWYAIRKTL